MIILLSSIKSEHSSNTDVLSLTMMQMMGVLYGSIKVSGDMPRLGLGFGLGLG